MKEAVTGALICLFSFGAIGLSAVGCFHVLKLTVQLGWMIFDAARAAIGRDESS